MKQIFAITAGIFLLGIIFFLNREQISYHSPAAVALPGRPDSLSRSTVQQTIDTSLVYAGSYLPKKASAADLRAVFEEANRHAADWRRDGRDGYGDFILYKDLDDELMLVIGSSEKPKPGYYELDLSRSSRFRVKIEKYPAATPHNRYCNCKGPRETTPELHVTSGVLKVWVNSDDDNEIGYQVMAVVENATFGNEKDSLHIKVAYMAPVRVGWRAG